MEVMKEKHCDSAINQSVPSEIKKLGGITVRQAADQRENM